MLKAEKKRICMPTLPKPNTVAFLNMTLTMDTNTKIEIESCLLGDGGVLNIFTYSAFLKHGSKGKYFVHPIVCKYHSQILIFSVLR